MKKAIVGVAVASLTLASLVAAFVAIDQAHVTICRATGSATQPYVKVAPSESGVLNAHAGQPHQDVRDIIPPFDGFSGQNWTPQGMAIYAGGCASVSGGAGGLVRLTICHATGSATRPYVEVAPSESGVLNGHAGQSHQDARDIIPPFDGFSGQNWTPQGMAIYASGCDVPAVGIPGGGAFGALGIAVFIGLFVLLAQTRKRIHGTRVGLLPEGDSLDA